MSRRKEDAGQGDDIFFLVGGRKGEGPGTEEDASKPLNISINKKGGGEFRIISHFTLLRERRERHAQTIIFSLSQKLGKREVSRPLDLEGVIEKERGKASSTLSSLKLRGKKEGRGGASCLEPAIRHGQCRREKERESPPMLMTFIMVLISWEEGGRDVPRPIARYQKGEEADPRLAEKSHRGRKKEKEEKKALRNTIYSKCRASRRKEGKKKKIAATGLITAFPP